MTNRISLLFKVIFLLSSLYVFSCATKFSTLRITIPEDYEMDVVEMKVKIPLNAGLYLNPSLKDYTYEGSLNRATAMTIFLMGDAFSKSCEKILKNIFQSVIIFDSIDNKLASQNIDVIIVPELLEIYVPPLRKYGLTTKPVDNNKMMVRWNIQSLDGKTIYTNTIMSEGVPKLRVSIIASSLKEVEKDNMLQLFRDQFRKAQDDIYSNAWWKNPWWKNSNK
jgi:hypothetical protein